jgi:hypothetical protein
MGQSSATAEVTHPDRDEGPAHLRKRRRHYWVTTGILCAVVLIGVADAFAPVLGVDSRTETVEAADGSTFEVEYPAVTRPALASPFAIEIIRPGGFDQEIEIAISRPWIEVWDENGFYPSPSGETGDEHWVVWTFEPPDGDTFRFFYDARLEPARQQDVAGTVELRDQGAVIAAIDFETEVRP